MRYKKFVSKILCSHKVMEEIYSKVKRNPKARHKKEFSPEAAVSALPLSLSGLVGGSV
jgi:hypothetical protein